MVVTIELFGAQREIANAEILSMTIPGKMILRDALKYIEDRYPILALTDKSVNVAVNGEIVSLDQLLKAHDVISIVPHIGGG